MLKLAPKNENQAPKKRSHYKRVIHNRAYCCILFHRWVSIGVTGLINYQECKDCKARMAEGLGFISNDTLAWVMGNA